MNDPLIALIIGVVILGAGALVLWPSGGLRARWQRMRRSDRRVMIEDALKHLYDFEYKGIPCTLASIGGALSVAGDDAAELLNRLIALSLLKPNGEVFELTGDGRSYALRVIRMHRLWERYLADETGVRETEWHAKAEEKEHDMTPAQADMLSARMGNPRFDPHGDPIPTSSGDLPSPAGIPLTSVDPGQVAMIVHIEDEPATVYAQLVAEGLVPGMSIRVLEATNDRIRFEADGSEGVLAPVVATNVTVIPARPEQFREGPFETLDVLAPGESGRVIGISRRCRAQQRRRLMDLGIIVGTHVTAEMRSASGDPTAYQVRGATIALRKAHAGLIHIERENGENK